MGGLSSFPGVSEPKSKGETKGKRSIKAEDLRGAAEGLPDLRQRAPTRRLVPPCSARSLPFLYLSDDTGGGFASHSPAISH